MSSKVMIENRTDAARPFAWRTVALNGESLDRRRSAPDSKSASSDSHHPLEKRIAELEQLLETRTREAREAGLREGEAAAQAQAQEEVGAALDRVAQSIAEIDQYQSRLRRQTEMDAVRLSVAIARRVLRRELTVDPAAIEGLVGAALERLQSQESSRVRLHPGHVPALRVALERLGMSAKVEIIADPAQEPGAAIFEMHRGNLDASMDSQLREIERGLADRFQRPW
ncbi:MAG: Flagellar biosynthesis/type secretory pathway protein-like protein [Bryobacterales bacterium]|nr:Flagellar biosynthesis/type secretory pathway protein-like protein [Bryobacterales bacterium]